MAAVPLKDAQERRRPSTDHDLSCFTWNIAAINNNPFEYYATLDNEPGYEALMKGVQGLIDEPGECDVCVSEVFTTAMFDRLMAAMQEQGWEGIDQVETRWLEDFSNREIISRFLKDKEIGSKRIISMPDRYTNTINDATDGSIACRPSIINNYQVDMPTLDAWFDQWYEFMFKKQVSVKTKSGEVESKLVCALLGKISRAKYPALSEEEEAISIPLQVLALAIFDAILVHLVDASAKASGIRWQDIKIKLCTALVVHKQDNVLRVLREQVAPTADIIFMQEVAGAFMDAFRKSELIDRFVLLAPQSVDYVRDQNSLILVATDRVVTGGDAPEELGVHAFLGKEVPVADGDICAYVVPLQLGGSTRKCVLASFHGDTAGLASTPVVSAVRKAAAEKAFPVVFGLDANTHAHLDPKLKHIDEFLADIKVGPMPLHHSWQGDSSSRDTSWNTTFNARTYLQPQLNKAVRFDERGSSKLTDSNPKDFILFSDFAFDVAAFASRDNTGRGEFIEGMDFPTLSFPSDHALVTATLRLRTDAVQGKCCTVS